MHSWDASVYELIPCQEIVLDLGGNLHALSSLVLVFAKNQHKYMYITNWHAITFKITVVFKGGKMSVHTVCLNDGALNPNLDSHLWSRQLVKIQGQFKDISRSIPLFSSKPVNLILCLMKSPFHTLCYQFLTLAMQVRVKIADESDGVNPQLKRVNL